MKEELRSIIKVYIENVNSVCNNLLKSLDLKTKVDLWEYRNTHNKMEFQLNGISYRFHGRGCVATNDEMFIDWDFGYGSRWCGIEPWLLARTLERNNDDHSNYYDGNIIKSECEQAVLDGIMYKKYELYYFTIPVSETYEPDFPKEFDTLIVEHFDTIREVPRNKLVDRFLRKSKRIYTQIEKNQDLYTLRFILNGKEIYSILYNDIGYPENAVEIMNEVLRTY